MYYTFQKINTRLQQMLLLHLIFMLIHKTYLPSFWQKDTLKRVCINFVRLRTPWGEIQDDCRDGFETKTNWPKTIKLNSTPLKLSKHLTPPLVFQLLRLSL